MFTSGKIVIASSVVSASAITVQTDAVCGPVYEQIHAIAREHGLTTNQSSEVIVSDTQFCGVPPYDIVPGIDEWCDNNCLNPEFPFCPPDYCELCADDSGSFGGSFAGEFDIKELINKVSLENKIPVLVVADPTILTCDGSSSSTTYCGVPPYDAVPGIDCWCDNNCLNPEFPFCPDFVCELCGGDEGSFGGSDGGALKSSEEQAAPPAPPTIVAPKTAPKKEFMLSESNLQLS